jgi:pimeloyl-ACP methyl ester carboxylesterase
MQEKNMLFNDQPVYYRITGEGQPVMLVHGFAEDGTVWENQIDVLKAHYKLIIPDLPGSGKSVPDSYRDSHAQSTIPDWSMEYFATCLHAILLHENIKQVTMIGHSMGGYITLAFAEQYPDWLQAFCLFHSTAYPDNEEKIATRRRGIEFIKQNGPKKFLEQSIPNLFSETTKKQHPEIVQKVLTQYTYFPAPSLIGYYEAMIRRPDRTAVLQHFPRPILFIMGTNDTAIPLEQVLQQSHLPGISFVKIFDDTGHMGMMERVNDANQALLDFCKLAHI